MEILNPFIVILMTYYLTGKNLVGLSSTEYKTIKSRIQDRIGKIKADGTKFMISLIFFCEISGYEIFSSQKNYMNLNRMNSNEVHMTNVYSIILAKLRYLSTIQIQVHQMHISVMEKSLVVLESKTVVTISDIICREARSSVLFAQ